MGIEIERKFLVHQEKWAALNKPTGQFLKQGYLLTDPNKTIRVRVTDTSGFLTIKGLSVGATRPEFEYPIPKEEAVQLLELFSEANLTKIRYKIEYKNKVWEVDEFLEENEGLIVAEIELNDENEAFEIPDWIAEEVTEEDKYYNSNLTLKPYKHW